MLIIKSRKKRPLGLNEPLRHESHKKPVTRRDFLAQGFTTGAATVVAPAMLGAVLGSRKAHAALGKTLALPDVREALAKQGAEVFAGTPAEFRTFLEREIASTDRVIKAAQLQPE